MTLRTRRSPAQSAAQNYNREELERFARRLHVAMTAKGLSNSDLARAVWGETADGKGYKVARNRDRIGVYWSWVPRPSPRVEPPTHVSSTSTWPVRSPPMRSRSGRTMPARSLWRIWKAVS